MFGTRYLVRMVPKVIGFGHCIVNRTTLKSIRYLNLTQLKRVDFDRQIESSGNILSLSFTEESIGAKKLKQCSPEDLYS